MKDICVNKECNKRECELVNLKEYYRKEYNEEIYISKCPDKEPEYLELANKPKEIDIMYKKQTGGLLAVEIKKIVLKKIFEYDVEKLLNLLSEGIDKSQKTKYKVCIKIENSLKNSYKKIMEFINDFNNNLKYSYSDKCINIQFINKNDELLGYSEKDKYNEKDKLIGVYYDCNGLETLMKLSRKDYINLNEVVNCNQYVKKEIIRKLKSDISKFEKYKDMEKIFYFKLVFSGVQQELLDSDLQNELIDEIVSNLMKLNIDFDNYINRNLLDSVIIDCEIGAKSQILKCEVK